MKIEELKSRIDLHDLADRLGIKRAKGHSTQRDYALYHSPGRKDANPSLSIFNKDGRIGWKDQATGEGGSCIDLVMLAEGGDESAAVKRLHEIYGFPLGTPGERAPAREKSRAEYIADRCMAAPEPALAYLVEERGISDEVAQRAIRLKAVGFNDYTSPNKQPGEHGYGGPAVAFIVKEVNTSQVVAVDLRYLDKDLNGGTKTQCQGDKHGHFWTSDLKRLRSAKTVYFVESSINALSVECCRLFDSAAVSILGVGNVDSLPLDWMRGKQAILCFDNDEPFPDLMENGKRHPKAGLRPGLSAAWTLHERLTAMDISALLVDQSEWQYNDVNDILKNEGKEALGQALRKVEQWLIPGMCGQNEQAGLLDKGGKRRLYLPYHHENKYWRYRVRPDFTSWVSEIKQDPEGGPDKINIAELAGFRVAAVSRVTIASATATMTGDDDNAPKTMFAISVQTTRHGPELQRRVVDDEKLHNIETWKKFGPVFSQSPFLRMINLLENAAHIGARHAANFVGLCWREGRLVVNEGPDCYFTNPEQQCPYHNLTFPAGSQADARKVIEAYSSTYQNNAMLITLVWALGGHLKSLLGFWPHFQMQASKGSGKSTLIKRLERTIGFTMFSGQSLQTEFRLLTSISHTSHPVGWEEISARQQIVIDKAVSLLQESYQYTTSKRGADMTEFLLSAPVLLAGEDVPVKSLIGKLVRTELRTKGPLMANDLPRFPVRQWLDFLAGYTASQVHGLFEVVRAECQKRCRATQDDSGAQRMVYNYAAVMTAWRLLTEFAEIDKKFADFPNDLISEMNGHISDTEADREPWVWILDTALHEIATGNFKASYTWDYEGQDQCLYIRSSDIMHHLSSTPALRDQWNALPVKSDRIFKKQLLAAEVVSNSDCEKTIGGRRIGHMLALSLPRLETYGLHATPRIEP